MTITLSPEAEEQLNKTAQRAGQNADTFAASLLTQALHWHEQELAEEVAAVNEGLKAFAEGRTIRFEDWAAKMRREFNLPTHLSDEELMRE